MLVPLEKPNLSIRFDRAQNVQRINGEIRDIDNDLKDSWASALNGWNLCKVEGFGESQKLFDAIKREVDGVSALLVQLKKTFEKEAK